MCGNLISLCLAKAFYIVAVCFWLCRLEEILEVADNLAIDIPFIWLYLAQIVTPMLEGGLPMGQLFR